MTYYIEECDAQALEAKYRRMKDRAEELLEIARRTDSPEDWDAWKQADGEASGYGEGIADAMYGVTEDA